MIRKAFRMSVSPRHQAEYVRRHNPIWRDLEEVLLHDGVESYSIFLDPATDDLFAYAEIESEERWAIAETDERLVNMSRHNYVTARGGVEPNVLVTPDKKWVVFTGQFAPDQRHVYAVENERWKAR
jgi:L-rhamnose mutarotase